MNPQGLKYCINGLFLAKMSHCLYLLIIMVSCARLFPERKQSQTVTVLCSELLSALHYSRKQHACKVVNSWSKKGLKCSCIPYRSRSPTYGLSHYQAFHQWVAFLKLNKSKSKLRLVWILPLLVHFENRLILANTSSTRSRNASFEDGEICFSEIICSVNAVRLDLVQISIRSQEA